MSAAFEVIDGGLMTTLQDLGRIGHQAQGMPTAGALDAGNLRLANVLVGNEQGEAGLEMRILGPTLKVAAKSVRVALTGTEGFVEISGSEGRRIVEAGCSGTLHEGETLRVGAMRDTAVAYLAVEGGFDVPRLYGSRSTYVNGGFGGFEGRGLKAKDHVPLARDAASEGEEVVCLSPLTYRSEGPIRIVPGPQDYYFSVAGLEAFFGEEFTLSAEANRMGIRLEGPVIEHSKGADINSDGIVTGSIQVPGSGQPIILLADHQTTGGYPKIGTVASADISRLGRIGPGARLRFPARQCCRGRRGPAGAGGPHSARHCQHHASAGRGGQAGAVDGAPESGQCVVAE